MAATTPPPSLDTQPPSAAVAEQSTIEISEPLQLDDHEITSSTAPVEGNQIADDDQLQQQQQNNRQPDWPTLTVGFCLAAAAEMAVQARNTDVVSFPLLCMLLLLAFSAIFVAKNIGSNRADVARVLEQVGGFLGITAFFLAITIAFPLWLKVVSWAIYALALLVIFIYKLPPISTTLPITICCCSDNCIV